MDHQAVIPSSIVSALYSHWKNTSAIWRARLWVPCSQAHSVPFLVLGILLGLLLHDTALVEFYAFFERSGLEVF